MDEPGSTLHVVRGNPTDEELTAVVVAVATRRAQAAQRATVESDGWCDRAALLRRPLFAGPDAWRRAARPS